MIFECARVKDKQFIAVSPASIRLENKDETSCMFEDWKHSLPGLIFLWLP
jgi:hypothetical protein